MQNQPKPGPPDAIADVVCLQNMLNRGQWSAVEVPFIQRNIRILSEAVRAGLVRVPPAYQEKLEMIDPMLRARWDFVPDMWAIERWVEEDNFCRWELIAHRFCLDNKLIHDLIKGDTWKRGRPEEQLLAKRQEAENKRKGNEKASDERVAAAIDLLPKSHVDNFIAVEQAIASGERITARGDDFNRLDRLDKSARRSRARGEGDPPPERKAINKRFKVIDKRRIK